ncbi:hypothetical protein Q3Y64_14985 [Uliginosibacterium sp. 31-12]|nr:hypothetical protein [Uliginosibacterium sp. 31-12]
MRCAALLLAVACQTTMAASPELVCHYSYGGETRSVRQPQLASAQTAYTQKPLAIGSYFLFRPVFEPTEVKLYSLTDHPDGPLPLHVARYAYPAATRSQGKFGFTGEQRVYEPIRDSELVYWCEIQGPRETHR